MATSLIFFVTLFFIICGLVLVGIAFMNIATKSYRPKNANYIVITIVALFVINGILAGLSFGSLLSQLNISSNQNPRNVTEQEFVY